MSWSVQRGSGRLLVISNETGQTVTHVEMRLRGKAIGGMFGRRDWSVKQDEMADGDAVQAPFVAAMGARTDPPRIEITWTSPDGRQHHDVLDDLPL
ncbi:hypothetical protein [Mycolicibacterium sphagni]|uniref:Uncharacterized protein n=1 Tax=Mycolicibacterium sphagni TaxID=1786 RepID=A0ABX2JTC1_9MYCO|nr:hypothetical protein [Mycolicibacterium sphagni]NTY58730.1 hypothetical protein [Mycolicibacterium sphagni]